MIYQIYDIIVYHNDFNSIYVNKNKDFIIYVLEQIQIHFMTFKNLIFFFLFVHLIEMYKKYLLL